MSELLSPPDIEVVEEESPELFQVSSAELHSPETPHESSLPEVIESHLRNSEISQERHKEIQINFDAGYAELQQKLGETRLNASTTYIGQIRETSDGRFEWNNNGQWIETKGSENTAGLLQELQNGPRVQEDFRGKSNGGVVEVLLGVAKTAEGTIYTYGSQGFKPERASTMESTDYEDPELLIEKTEDASIEHVELTDIKEHASVLNVRQTEAIPYFDSGNEKVEDQRYGSDIVTNFSVPASGEDKLSQKTINHNSGAQGNSKIFSQPFDTTEGKSDVPFQVSAKASENSQRMSLEVDSTKSSVEHYGMDTDHSIIEIHNNKLEAKEALSNTASLKSEESTQKTSTAKVETHTIQYHEPSPTDLAAKQQKIEVNKVATQELFEQGAEKPLVPETHLEFGAKPMLFGVSQPETSLDRSAEIFTITRAEVEHLQVVEAPLNIEIRVFEQVTPRHGEMQAPLIDFFTTTPFVRELEQLIQTPEQSSEVVLVGERTPEGAILDATVIRAEAGHITYEFRATELPEQQLSMTALRERFEHYTWLAAPEEKQNEVSIEVTPTLEPSVSLSRSEHEVVRGRETEPFSFIQSAPEREQAPRTELAPILRVETEQTRPWPGFISVLPDEGEEEVVTDNSDPQEAAKTLAS